MLSIEISNASFFKAPNTKNFLFRPRYYDQDKERREQLIKEGNPGVDLIQISLTDIDSPKFREHITKLHNKSYQKN